MKNKPCCKCHAPTEKEILKYEIEACLKHVYVTGEEVERLIQAEDFVEAERFIKMMYFSLKEACEKIEKL